MKNTQVLLARRPQGVPTSEDFAVRQAPVPEIQEGQFLVENLYLSLDAGFLNWMGEDSGDEILPAMPLGAPVMGLTLGRVLQSRHAEHPEGELLMARLAWEQYSVTDGSDFMVPVDPKWPHPLRYHLGVLGDTGMSAYFGLTDIGRPAAGETVLISAAGGAVGSIAGQIAKLKGARTVGLAGSDEKCARLRDELGYDAAINHTSSNLSDELAALCPEGVSVYFDNVGGPLLEVVLEHIVEGARIPFCGAVATYSAPSPLPGPSNLFQLVVHSARLEGFMTHLQVDRYDEARQALSTWLSEGQIESVEYIHQGVEQAGNAFCDLFAGRNFGKSIVQVAEDGVDG